jgi:hypothetical protein
MLNERHQAPGTRDNAEGTRQHAEGRRQKAEGARKRAQGTGHDVKRTARNAAVIVFALVGLFIGDTVGSAQTSSPERLTFEEAIRRALEKNPDIAEAAQAILRAETLLQEARTVYRPTVSANVTSTLLDSERGFDEFVTQPRLQTLMGASVSYPVLAATRWAQRAQAQDQVRVARLGVGETRRQIALATAQSYLAVIAQQRQVDVNTRWRMSNTRALFCRAVPAAD